MMVFDLEIPFASDRPTLPRSYSCLRGDPDPGSLLALILAMRNLSNSPWRRTC